jgi:hypothetical protein
MASAGYAASPGLVTRSRSQCNKTGATHPRFDERSRDAEASECDFDSEAMEELARDSLFICPVCAHWIRARRPHPTEFVALPADLDAWFPPLEDRRQQHHRA